MGSSCSLALFQKPRAVIGGPKCSCRPILEKISDVKRGQVIKSLKKKGNFKVYPETGQPVDGGQRMADEVTLTCSACSSSSSSSNVNQLVRKGALANTIIAS